MNKFFTIFKTIFNVATKAAPFAVSMIAPGLMPMLTTILTGIASAEAKFPASGQGESKAEHAMTAVAAEAPQIIATFEQLTGKKLVDDVLFAQGCTDLNNALVKVLNSFGVLKIAPPTATPLPT